MCSKKPVRMVKHHRKPKSLGGSNSRSNVILIPAKAHRAWHQLVWNLPPDRQAEELSKLTDPDYYFVAVKKEHP